jgi:hypothetical protein
VLVAKGSRCAFVPILNHVVSTPTIGGWGCNCDGRDVADA